jgi:hypothetical protein
MTHRYSNSDHQLLACNPIDGYMKRYNMHKDTCLQIPLAATRDFQNRGLGNSLAARSLRDDRQAKNNQYT